MKSDPKENMVHDAMHVKLENRKIPLGERK